jgi:mycofactocin precursor
MTEQAVLEQAVLEQAGGEEKAQLTEAANEPAEDEALVAGELLVEEVSIDGMCGVY